MRIRDAEPGDARDLARVHVRAWQLAYGGGLMPESYLEGLTVEDRAAWWTRVLGTTPGTRSRRLVAHHGDEPVCGFILVGPESGEGTGRGEVHALNVDPRDWGRGTGRGLLEAGVAHLADVGFEEAVLWVHPGNDRARRFYEHNGWQDDDAVREEVIVGISVSEMRYRRPLGLPSAA